MPAATVAQIAGRCTAASPIPIGKSTVRDSSGPYVAIAASVEGVVAAWSSSESEITTIPLDSTGQPRGEGRLLNSESNWLFPLLWELGDGMFVLAFVPPVVRAFNARVPRRALQRVDATGEHIGNPVTFALDTVKDATHFQNELMILTSFTSKRELLRVMASKEGLAVRPVALPERPTLKTPAHKTLTSLRERLLVTSKGAAVVVVDFGDGITVIEREDGGRLELTLPEGFRHQPPVLNAEDEVLWPSCGSKTSVAAIKAGSSGAVEVLADQSVCARSSRWGVVGDWSPYNGKSRGILFRTDPLKPGIKLSEESREFWAFKSTWTGTHVLAIYAKGHRGAWTVVVHPITCEGAPS
jgi:hypothetical protein